MYIDHHIVFNKTKSMNYNNYTFIKRENIISPHIIK